MTCARTKRTCGTLEVLSLEALEVLTLEVLTLEVLSLARTSLLESMSRVVCALTQVGWSQPWLAATCLGHSLGWQPPALVTALVGSKQAASWEAACLHL